MAHGGHERAQLQLECGLAAAVQLLGARGAARGGDMQRVVDKGEEVVPQGERATFAARVQVETNREGGGCEPRGGAASEAERRNG